VHSQQIGFIPEKYQTLLALLQQSKSSYNASNQIFVIPSNTITHSGNKFLSSFSSWILGSRATDHICSSLTHFTSYHQINHILSNYQLEIKSLQIILGVFLSIKIMS